MKNLIILLALFCAFSCSDPIHVTTKGDAYNTTSGTMGSSKAENELLRRSIDSSKTLDTTRIKQAGKPVY